MASAPPFAPRQAYARPIRLMIVDDSIVARTVLARMLESRREFEIVAVAGTASEALRILAAKRVDIILLDVEMPEVDGLTALPDILAASNGARVLIVSSAAEDGAVATLKALTLGAADTLLKPGAGSFAGRFADILAERLLRIGVVEETAHAAEAGMPPVRTSARRDPFDCVAIGASTGGMHALSAFFQALDPDFTAPILITQHLPAMFMPYFAAQLREIAGRPARVAGDGTRIVPGEIFVAPGDAHMRMIRMRDGARIVLDHTPAPSGCLPSVDPMFSAFAHVFGARGLGIVLSGMGRDGVLGAAELVAAGGELIAQDAASSVVWGMPGAVANASLATAVMPPAAIARRIAARAGLGA